MQSAVRWDATTIALLGTTLGLVIGTGFGWAIVTALEGEGISEFHVPIASLGVITLISALAGVTSACGQLDVSASAHDRIISQPPTKARIEMSSVQHHELQEIADHAMASIADQLLLPQSYYTDVLLDLLVVAPSSIVRSAIADRLSEIRFVSMVATDEVRADLYGIVAISDFSDAASDDLAWAEQALMCDCTTCVAALNAEQGRSSCSEVHAEGAQAMFADTNTQHRTSTTRNTNAVDRATRRDIDCQARASEFLTDLIGSPPENLLWDDTYPLQGHSQLHGRELVVIAPRDEHHQTVVLTAEDWDAVRRATTDQRRDLLDTCAIADHERLVAVMATTTTPRAA